ncbi:unnamed protein product [Umbelopsis vinacea]
MAIDPDAASDPTDSSGTPYKKTRHFLEFLAVSHIGMFDNFAGDLLDTDDDADDEEQARFVPLYRDERVAGSTERSPLLQRKSSHMADLGTVTETKAVSLLLKAFVGSESAGQRLRVTTVDPNSLSASEAANGTNLGGANSTMIAIRYMIANSPETSTIPSSEDTTPHGTSTSRTQDVRRGQHHKDKNPPQST